MAGMEKFYLRGKVALVTGAGKNLGRAIALSLAEAGADVVVTSRTRSEIESTEEQIRERGQKALAITMDVTDFQQVETAVEKIVSEFGRIDILVNNAATRSFKSLLEISKEEWQKVIDTNLTGVFLCCKAVGPVMIRQGGGRIINVSSRSGLHGMVNRGAYSASKGGLIQLTQVLALEWAQYGILVHAVAPGLLSTRHAADFSFEKRISAIPLKRVGQFEEVALLIVYLASEACTYMTGEVILIDGGMAAK